MDGSKSNAHQQGAAVTSTTSSAGKRKGKAASSCGGGKKPPIKVVFVGNPVRVKTSVAGFRALVQELTGRHADPYKYSVGDADDADDSSSGGSGSPVELQVGGALSSDSASAAGVAQVISVPAYDDDDDDGFAPQLIDNSYSVFSPPTFLYGPHGGEL